MLMLQHEIYCDPAAYHRPANASLFRDVGNAGAWLREHINDDWPVLSVGYEPMAGRPSVNTAACKRLFSLGRVPHIPCALCSRWASRQSPTKTSAHALGRQRGTTLFMQNQPAS